jgi:hypothetical protein
MSEREMEADPIKEMKHIPATVGKGLGRGTEGAVTLLTPRLRGEGVVPPEITDTFGSSAYRDEEE